MTTENPTSDYIVDHNAARFLTLTGDGNLRWADSSENQFDGKQFLISTPEYAVSRAGADITLHLPDGRIVSVKDLADRLEAIEARLDALESNKEFEWDK